MKRSLIYLIIILVAIGSAVGLVLNNRNNGLKLKTEASPSPEPVSKNLISAPGRVEPISEEIRVGAEISGKLKAVLVEEGDRVARGQVIAILQDDDYRARLASAEARLKQKEAEQRRVVNGSRDQERREAFSSIREAEAVMMNMQTELDRRRSLHLTGDIAREEVERAERQLQVAKARYDASVERHSFIDAAAREEDVARARAEIELARAGIAEARALLEKTIVRSPINGVILRKHLRTGESVSSSSNGASEAIVTLADPAVLRVRVDVDEVDVGKLAIGRRAWVIADTYAGQKFWGRVVRIGEVLGKKNVRTGEPNEKVDTKILETLIELDPGSSLKLGLRVDAFIESGQPQKAEY